MTFKELEDSLVVQANLLSRVDRKIEELTERIHDLLGVMESHESRLGIMQVAMTALFEHIDRFIRGLESNGHRGGQS